jgi:hypothetical protein
VVQGWLRRPVHGEQKAAAELVLAGAVEDEARMREDEIGRAVEHQWVTDDGGQWWRRRSGEGVITEKRECGGKEVRQRVNKITEQSSGVF